MKIRFIKLINKIFVKISPILPMVVYDKLLVGFSEEVKYKSLKARIEKYAKKLLKNPKDCFEKIINNQRVMMINEGSYLYDYFNVCYLNNMVNLILYSLYKGCIPIIKINANQKSYNKWEWYFKQPIEIILNKKEIPDGYKVEVCQIKDSPFGCSYEDGFYPYSKNFHVWKFLYKKFVVFNDTTENYIEMEKQQLLKEKTLGVLLRGTDFTSLCPSGHPIQPAVEDVLEQAKIIKEKENYKNIYVATEEERLFNKVKLCFGAECVLSNNRTYYDEQYYGDEHNYIGEIHFERENDNYLKGLEYLSSITILSACEGIVSGNCGGNLYALLRAKHYEDIYVFNEGYYQ